MTISHYRKKRSVYRRRPKKGGTLRRKRQTFRKITGGDLSTPTFSVPLDKFYPLNTYEHDPSYPPGYSSERLTQGGKRRKTYRRRMNGGSVNLTSITTMQDPLIQGPYAQSFPNEFANVAGSGTLAYSLLGQHANVGNIGGIVSVNSTASALV